MLLANLRAAAAAAGGTAQTPEHMLADAQERQWDNQDAHAVVH